MRVLAFDASNGHTHMLCPITAQCLMPHAHHRPLMQYSRDYPVNSDLGECALDKELVSTAIAPLSNPTPDWLTYAHPPTHPHTQCGVAMGVSEGRGTPALAPRPRSTSLPRAARLAGFWRARADSCLSESVEL